MYVYVYRMHMYYMHVYAKVFMTDTVITVVLTAQVINLFLI